MFIAPFSYGFMTSVFTLIFKLPLQVHCIRFWTEPLQIMDSIKCVLVDFTFSHSGTQTYPMNSPNFSPYTHKIMN